MRWIKSTRSGSSGGDCVEMRTEKGRVFVRDSKLGDASPILGMQPEDLSAVIAKLRK